ncbi:MAG TPA: hypothetical protein VHM70_26685 [Polyangiaceae bacterium]|nr:hypothetical protein [Polyangiaceae bacterium]
MSRTTRSNPWLGSATRALATRHVGKATLPILVSWVVSASGCHASAQAHANSSGDVGAKADAYDDLDEHSVEDERGRVAEFADTPEAAPGTTLLGARHDLFLKSGTSSCRCIAAAAGQPNDPRFGWEAQVPALDPNHEMVVAFKNESCPDSTPDLGAAYRGYRTTETGDVVVMIEAAREGRPQLYGAIVPRPQGQGRLLIEPFPRALPYGQPLTGKDCSVKF